MLALLYTLNILLTYPIQIFPAHIIIDHLMGKQQKQATGKMTKAKIILFRLALTLFIYISAYLIPNLTPLLGLLGAFFGTVVQFFYPVLLHWVYFKQQSLATKLTYVGLLGFSMVSVVFGTYESGKNLLISMK